MADGYGAGVLIVADDLTGAADAAGAFASAGHRCVVLLGVRHGEAPVVSLDTHSREMSASAAFEATAQAVRLNPDRRVFVKIDSTVRGHVKVTVEAALSALSYRPSRIVVCPAFPERGRTVFNGWVHVDGIPINGGSLRDVFTRFPAGAGLFIPSARTDDEIAGIVQSMPDDVLWVGAAGLARHVANRLAPTPLQPGSKGDTKAGPESRPPAARRVVVVAGSQNERTFEQLAALDSATTVIRVDPRADTLRDEIVPSIRGADALVLTGGHTARSVLDVLGIDTVTIGGEVEAGVPWGTAVHDDRPISIVTKAGGFGDQQTMRRAVAFLLGS